MSGGGGGSGNGGGDMQVSGMEAAVSQEKGISTHADTKTSASSYSGGDRVGHGEGKIDPGLAQATVGQYTGVTPSNVGINPNTGQLEQESNFYSGLDNEQQAEYDQGKAISQGTLEVVTDDQGNTLYNDDGSVKTKPGRYQINPETGDLESKDLTFSEHWNNAPKAIRWSPTLRFLYSAGKNLDEWAKSKGWNWNSGTGKITDNQGNDVGERHLMNTAAPDAPGLVSGQSNTQTTSGSYSASQWYANLGNTNTTGSNPFSFSTAFADAKAKQQTILGNPSAVRQLAVNESPFYNWLKENSLNKGIL